ncbi:MAG TPA: hypothetical protein VHB72_01215 [Candidatus Saccharimonadales bacterium]|nr:hypothetical protein [Candidatus Saccharimonadales bacterium]
MSEISPITNRYLGVMRSAHKTTEVFGIPLIDTDLAPSHAPFGPENGSIHGFSRRLSELAEDIDDDEPLGGFMKHNIYAALLAMPVLSGKLRIGHDIEYADFVEHTTGIRPEMTPESSDDPAIESLAVQRYGIEEAVARLGFSFRPEDRSAFHAAYAMDPESTEDTVTSLVEKSKRAVGKIIGNTILQDEGMISVNIGDFGASWQAYASADEHQNLFADINVNPSFNLSAAEEELIVSHELAHLASFAIKKSALANGDLHPAAALVLAFSSMYPQQEVIARVAEAEVVSAQGEDPLFQFLAKHGRYTVDVGVNMMLFANSGASKEEVEEYGAAHLPFHDPERIKQQAKDFADNLLFKTVFAVDSEVLRIAQRIAAMPVKEKQSLLQRMCIEPLSPAELRSLGSVSMPAAG